MASLSSTSVIKDMAWWVENTSKLRMSSHNLPTILVSSFGQPENKKEYSSTDYTLVMLCVND